MSINHENIPNQNLPKVADKQPTCIRPEPGKVYAWCTCGLSEKITFCDGIHKKIEGLPFKSLKVEFKENEEEVWFCNCKQTKNPPYCDGSHNQLK